MDPHSATASTAKGTAAEEAACFECDAPVNTEWREHTFTYGVGDSAVDLTATLPVRVCGSCGFEFLDQEAETLQHEAVCTHLGVLTPKEIRAIRKKHGMSRAEFSRVTGLGEATLNRWENAILIQNTGNDRYLRLLMSPGNLQQLQRLEDSRVLSPDWGTSKFRVLSGDVLRRHQERQQDFRLTPVGEQTAA